MALPTPATAARTSTTAMRVRVSVMLPALLLGFWSAGSLSAAPRAALPLSPAASAAAPFELSLAPAPAAPTQAQLPAPATLPAGTPTAPAPATPLPASVPSAPALLPTPVAAPLLPAPPASSTLLPELLPELPLEVGIAAAQAPGRAPLVLRPHPSIAAQPVRFAEHDGFDISYPQCGRAIEAPTSLAIIGVNGGRPGILNPCLGEQWLWASQAPRPELYLNVAAPRTELLDNHAVSRTGPAGTCQDPTTARSCEAFNVAYSQASASLEAALAQGVELERVARVWLDVELANYWSEDTALNRGSIRGVAAAVSDAGLRPGIYSLPRAFDKVTGTTTPSEASLGMWRATGAATREKALEGCHKLLGGVLPERVQWIDPALNLDMNAPCPAPEGLLSTRLAGQP